jgi:hypothetical protein
MPEIGVRARALVTGKLYIDMFFSRLLLDTG